jgi:hypothetical protein
MGDRASILIKEQDGGQIYFYTHWRGLELWQTLQDALQRGRGRWKDDPYLSRIIFSEMIKDDVLEERGFGISTFLCDSEYPILEVHLSIREVVVNEKHFSFDEYLVLKKDPRFSEENEE